MRAGLCIGVLKADISAFFFGSAAAAVSCRLYHTGAQALRPSRLLRGSHGTTAIAQQLCVGHYYACVDIAYACQLGVCYDTFSCV